MAGNGTDPGRSVTSKVTAILSTFQHGETFSLTEIARLTNLPVSTAHRLTNELVACDLLDRPNDGHFRISAHLRGIAGNARHEPPTFRDRARRVMEDLAAATGRCVVHLGRLENLRLIYLEKTPGNSPVHPGPESGTMPLHATAMGRVLLAFAPQRIVDAVVTRGLPAYTPLTCTSADQLRHTLAIIRSARMAVCRHEYDPQGSSVAVPIFGLGGSVVAALELSLRDAADVRMIEPPLVVAARSLTRDLQNGWRTPD
jgi:DNA-binding IclR family transcriptional regulator